MALGSSSFVFSPSVDDYLFTSVVWVCASANLAYWLYQRKDCRTSLLEPFSSSPKMVLWLKGHWTSVDLVLPSAVWFVCFQYLHCWCVEKNDCTALLKYSLLFGFADRWAEYSTVNAGNILHISCRYCGTCQLEFNRSNAIEDCWNLGR